MGHIVIFVTIFFILAFIGIVLAHKQRHYWSVYKKQYVLLSILILCGFISIILISPNDNDIVHTIIMPVLTGLITSIIFGVLNIESDPKFAETVSQNVVGFVNDTVPCIVYPSCQKENGDGELENKLTKSLNTSKKFIYSGLTMGIASKCIEKYIQYCNVNIPENRLNEMFFIIPAPNNLYYKDKKKMKIMKSSIKRILNSCSKATHEVIIKFYILPYRPPLHIHMTDEFCFWGLVDKRKDGFPCPTTYCYKKSENKESMYKTIDGLIEQTKWQVEEQKMGKIFTVVCGGYQKGEKKSVCITYKCNGIKQSANTIDDFFNAINAE
ncbi:MAG: hypothetical protein J1E57_06570 [Prevotella sp.]|nr:hypothetical protein [Prevotella sp.]